MTRSECPLSILIVNDASIWRLEVQWKVETCATYNSKSKSMNVEWGIWCWVWNEEEWVSISIPIVNDASIWRLEVQWKVETCATYNSQSKSMSMNEECGIWNQEWSRVSVPIMNPNCQWRQHLTLRGTVKRRNMCNSKHLHIYIYTSTSTHLHLHIYIYTSTSTHLHLHIYIYNNKFCFPNPLSMAIPKTRHVIIIMIIIPFPRDFHHELIFFPTTVCF